MKVVTINETPDSEVEYEIDVFIQTDQEKHKVFSIAPSYGIKRFQCNPDEELKLDDGNRVIVE